MKLLLIGILSLFCTVSSYAQDYLVTLKITEGERSKDSHSRIMEYKLDGMKVSVNESFTGMRSNEQGQSFSYTLKQGDFQRIKGSIDKLLLETKGVPYADEELKSYLFVELSVISKEDRTNWKMHGPPEVIKEMDFYKSISKIAEDLKSTVHCYE